MRSRFSSLKTSKKLAMRESNMRRHIQSAVMRLGLNCYVTNIVLSVDWRYATIYCISSMDDDDNAAANNLEAMSKEIAKMVIDRCAGHFFPKLRFAPDKEVRRQQKVNEIMMSIHNESDNSGTDKSGA